MRKAQGKARCNYNSKAYQIGFKRLVQIRTILLNRGYDVEYADLNYNGVDLKAWRRIKNWQGEPDEVYEVTNYSQSSYMNYRRALHYIYNLKQYPNSKKIMVVSYWDNIKALASLFKQDNIQIKVMGKQEL